MPFEFLQRETGVITKFMKNKKIDLTLEEKLRLLSGKDCWRTYGANGKLKEVFMSDGPNGLRMIADDGQTKKATAMPNISVIANSWSKKAAHLAGETIADDCIENGADILLAPGVNIKRTPLCGRNFEYFSEDPYLAGTLAKEYIDGVQSKGVGTSLKHYCLNNREYDRLFTSSEIEERAMREIYLTAFEIALKAKPWTVMCSYNRINGIYASENKYLISDVLRGEFGFDGVVVSDWGAVHSQFRRVKAGIDIEMPVTDKSFEDLKISYEKGLITDKEIDACAERVIGLAEKSQKADKTKKIEKTKAERHAAAVEIAKEGIVLLKNDDDILPLKAKKSGKILVSGTFANEPAPGGGGSAYVETDFKQEPLEKLIAEKLGKGAVVDFTKDVNYTGDGYNFGLNKAIEAAYSHDTVVVCVGTGRAVETEGKDRTDIKLPFVQEAAILKIANANPNVIVVVYAGSAIDMSAWIDEVKAVVYAGFMGEAANEAVSDILCGKTSPSGKLAETFPVALENTSVENDVGDGFVDWYQDGIFVGYRFYDTFGKDVLFPFGHGLSYANFVYSDLKIEKTGECECEVSYTVKNTGKIAAKEISQVYVKDECSFVIRPEKELKGYSKDLIKPNEEKRVTIKLCPRSFAYYSVNLKDWHVENGTFEILVGASSRDIRLSGKIEINLPEETQFTR